MSKNLEIVSLELLEAMTQNNVINGMREAVENTKKGGEAPLFVIWQRISPRGQPYAAKVLESGLNSEQILNNGIKFNPDISIQIQSESNKFWFTDFVTAYKVFQHKVLYHFGVRFEVYNDGKMSNKKYEIKLSHERNKFFNEGKISAVVTAKELNKQDFNYFVDSFQKSQTFLKDANEYLRNN